MTRKAGSSTSPSSRWTPVQPRWRRKTSGMIRKEVHAADEAHRKAVAEHKRQQEIFGREQPK